MPAPKLKCIVTAVSLALVAGTAQAVLERVGPTDLANGFPRWYQDTTGISVELCLPQNQAELDGGYCLLLPGDPPVVPEVFPSAFFDEHFWWAADASLVPATGGRALLVLALEAAFAADVTPGGQMAFTRVRVRLDPAPVSGTYRFIHPYGEEAIEANAGDRIFFTDDVGIGCPPGEFQCAMEGRVGPFLLPASVPGGPEIGAITGPVAGKRYIADPARLGPVTGSVLPAFLGSDNQLHNHNVFRIEGPVGSGLGGPGIDFIETTDFSLMGRLYTGQMPSRVTTDRASYGRTSTQQKVDVFATAFPTAAARLPGGPPPAGVAPVMSFFNVPCATILDAQGNITGFAQPAGGIETLMTAQGNARFGQLRPPTGSPIPDSVCVKDNSAVDVQGTPVPAYHQLPVNDSVVVSGAYYDLVAETLTVQATSSDQVSPPTLTLTGYNVPFANGVATVSGVTAPPASVRVLSAARGSTEAAVDAGMAAAPAASTEVVAGNDAAVTDEDTVVVIPVLAGDTLNGAAIDPVATPVTLTIIANGSKGTAVPNNATGNITYTPKANLNGLDSFTYTLTVNGVTSNIATVGVNIAPVNDAPVVSADSAAGAAGTALIVSVLANDSDVDGDTLAIVSGSVTAPVGPLGTTSSATVNSNGTVTFLGNGAGTYTFSYRATDGKVVSAPVPVTVTLSAPETVNAQAVEYVLSKNRWKVSGNTSIAAAHQLTLKFTGLVGGSPCNASGRVIGTTTSGGGSFTFDIGGATGLLDPRNTNCTAVRVESELGGVDPSTPIQLK